jgi:hypothetical protein
MPWVNRKRRLRSRTYWIAGFGAVAAAINFAVGIVTDPKVLSALGILLAATMAAMREFTNEPVREKK